MTKENQYYAALLARDYRFDGKFFPAVKTTGIYCRPICPARPKRENVEFFDTAGAAERAGYRPCLRCRPEAAPLSPLWYGKTSSIQRAIRYILDFGFNQNFESFAKKFGFTSRHLRRLFVEEIGKTPKQLYEDQRLNLARKLVVETSVPITEIAYTSGYQSLRRFNDAFKTRFTKSPSLLRKGKKEKNAGTELTLSYRPPMNFAATLGYLGRHELREIKTIDAGSYERLYSTENGPGRLRVTCDSSKNVLRVHFSKVDRHQLFPAIRNLRRLFDLDADPLLVSTAFENSPVLAELDRQNPGGRSPGAWDPFETAVMILMNQGVTMAFANELMAQIKDLGKDGFFPTARQLARADLTKVKTTQMRREVLGNLAEAVASGEIELHPHQDCQAVKKKLLAIKGIGPWTVECIGMRCLSDPDSFPRGDLVIDRMEKKFPNLNLDAVSPWRSYAAYHLWQQAAKDQKV